jgi:hypothetical protein
MQPPVRDIAAPRYYRWAARTERGMRNAVVAD